ncbi:protein FdhD [Clostridium homopropionicum DSM 5847]|uniref:Sulfur carrier protein FdhD n=1 Tax=Clostridium homopropionicum DSM 5847 TaxID=1121318 RepID=A0A0L6ZD32_9CLOT|nr:formate dehydrogenase accessory sulfurtransferase FdhD [Clostridium homopropionicum]KOA20683.1 protein FdhD [Clostridium homopropionicum DSM 5847]SFF91556.1 FdhD protein [Clostridium homopropionicum]
MKSTKIVNIKKINAAAEQKVTDEIIVEKILNIFVNRNFYFSLMCTPNEITELTIGFLFAEEIISSMEEVVSIEELIENNICVILKKDLEKDFEKRKAFTSGCGKGSIDLSIFEEFNLKPVEGNTKYSVNEILSMMKEFNNKSQLFKETGGAHSCSICDNTGIIYFSEDIGRHNALDKVIGKSIMDKLDLKEKLLMTTGRISSDIAVKAAKIGIPIIVSHSAPTDMALDIAKSCNITMIGFARGNRMNIYCGEHRIL